MRAAAAHRLERAGDQQSAVYAAELLGKASADPSWRNARPEILNVAIDSPSPEGNAAMRAMLRQPPDVNNHDVARAFMKLIESDAVEDRAAVLDFFSDDERFNTARGRAPEQWTAAIKPLMSDLLEDRDPKIRRRACVQLVGDESDARRWHADVCDEVRGYPCKRLDDGDRAEVAAVMRRSLGLRPPRQPLPASARLAPMDPEKEARAACRSTVLCTTWALAVSPDGTKAVTTDCGSSLGFWDVTTRCQTRTSYADGEPRLAFASDALVVSLTSGSVARVYDFATGEIVRRFERCEKPGPRTNPTIDQAARAQRAGPGAIAGNGKVVATTGDGVCLWSFGDGKLLRWLDPCAGSPAPASQIALTPDGSAIAAACAHEVRWFAIPSGTELGRASLEGDFMFGKMAALGSARELRLVTSELGPPGSPKEAFLRLRDGRKKAEAWSISLGPTHKNRRFAEFPREGNTRAPLFAFSPTADRMVLGGQGVCLWDMLSGQKIRCLVEPTIESSAVAWSRDGGVVVAGVGNTIRTWRGDELAKP
jgi:hypothetical protein